MSEEAFTVANAIAHTTVQLISVPMGVVLDWGFATLFNKANAYIGLPQDDNAIDSGKKFAVACIEVGAQIVGSGLIVAFFLNYLAGLSFESSDPASGSTFILMLFASQMRLRAKLDAIISYVNTEFMLDKSYVERKMGSWWRNANTTLGNTGAKQRQQQTKRSVSTTAARI